MHGSRGPPAHRACANAGLEGAGELPMPLQHAPPDLYRMLRYLLAVGPAYPVLSAGTTEEV